jgi:drug/metabolite transporter (DMT)-like permease
MAGRMSAPADLSTTSHAASNRKALLVLCFAIVYLVWGSSYLATAVGVRNLPPLLFGGVRFLAGGFLLAMLALLLGRSLRIDRQEFKTLCVVALGAVVISNGLNSWAMQRVPSNQAALLNATAALWIAIFATRGRRAHPLTRLTLGGLLLGFCGAALVVWPRGSDWSGSHMLEQFGILFGMVAWAAATIYLRNAIMKLDILSFTAWQMLLGGVVLCAIGLAVGEGERWQLSQDGLLALGYLTIMSSCFAYTAFAYLTVHASPGMLGTNSYVNPSVAAVLGWVFLDERLSLPQFIGMAVMLAGVALVGWPRRAPPAKPPD